MRILGIDPGKKTGAYSDGQGDPFLHIQTNIDGDNYQRCADVLRMKPKPDLIVCEAAPLVGGGHRNGKTWKIGIKQIAAMIRNEHTWRVLAGLNDIRFQTVPARKWKAYFKIPAGAGKEASVKLVKSILGINTSDHLADAILIAMWAEANIKEVGK